MCPAQLSDAQGRIASLEEDMKLLSAQLEHAKQNEKHLSNTLSSTRDALQVYHQTAHQNVEHKDQELSQLQVEINILEQQRKSLEGKVGDSRGEIERLEAAHVEAQEEILRLQEKCGQMQVEYESSIEEKDAELSQVREEKEDMERELADKVSELQQQIAAAREERNRAEELTSNYDGQLSKLKEMHCQCQEEAGKLRAVLEAKEEELSRMLTALQVSSAQVCVCVCVCVCVTVLT